MASFNIVEQMSEPVDFDAIARYVLVHLGGQVSNSLHAIMVEELRHVWNARGTVDLAMIAMELTPAGSPAAGPSLRTLGKALRGLDR
jgi:hypothetical protein